MSLEKPTYVLTITCPDAMGIVAAVAGFLADRGCFITESSHFGDVTTGRFFMRTVFQAGAGDPLDGPFTDDFAAIAGRFSMEWRLHDAQRRQRVLIMVSKLDHCLNDLLYRHRVGALKMDVAGVVSNHPDLAGLVAWRDIPFHHLPVTRDSKAAQEEKLIDLVEAENVEFVILARYMQIFSPALCRRLAGRAINIHHSFLPSFKGARPYHRAHVRGVKIIGATAHYVTEDLDEGPIIDQAVERVDHTHTPEELVAVGRDLESLVLARAVRAHLEHRVLLNGVKTVVFR
ncbi:MAG: formyltetrahydrofolate deformylase [Alphaproteobacteria bacterium]|nr:formyltetrahydrofolate deformylase [Alphaproteobacteria bacterium]